MERGVLKDFLRRGRYRVHSSLRKTGTAGGRVPSSPAQSTLRFGRDYPSPRSGPLGVRAE